MDRRGFFKTGAALGLVGAGGTLVLPDIALAGVGRRTEDGDIRLSSNENPLGVSDAARAAILESISLANRYPAAQRQELIETLAAYLDLSPENIVTLAEFIAASRP